MIPIILIVIIIFFYYRERTKDIRILKKMYNKQFIFNKLKYNYYSLFQRLFITPRSNIVYLKVLNEYNIQKTDTLLEIGSGEGFNLLYLNKKYNFKQIIGVEIDKSIYEISKKNINMINSKNIKLVNKDILDYGIPTSVNYIYLFNPFTTNYWSSKTSDVEYNKYKSLIKLIKNSYDKKNREIIIIFINIKQFNDHKVYNLFKENFTLEFDNNIKVNLFEKTNCSIFYYDKN
tara:strand:- start:111 stop:806 length:696 start_codon:yes stop_codon:yes gene_type:complete